MEMCNNTCNENNKEMSQSYKTRLDCIDKLRNVLPPVFTRQHISKYLGGILTPKSLANLDAREEGPPMKLHMGKRIGYERESFLEWLESKLVVSSKSSINNSNAPCK